MSDTNEIDRLLTWIEDLQAGCYINCVYCGHRYGPDDEVPASMAEVLKAHVEQCPRHPMSILRKEIETKWEPLLSASKEHLDLCTSPRDLRLHAAVASCAGIATK